VSASAVHPFGAVTPRPFSDKPLRVLTLTPFFPSVEADSTGCFVSEPLPFTERLGTRNEVIAVSPFYRGRSHIEPPEIPSQHKTYFSFPGNFGLPAAGRFLSSALIKTVRKMHSVSPFGLIHAHGALPCGHAAMSLGESLGIPFVVTVHGLDAFSDRQVSGKIGNWCRRVSLDVYRSARTVICISEKVRESVGDVPANCVVVHNGVDPNMFFPAPEADSPFTVLSVGNLIPIKGHALLIRAFARTREVVTGAILEIIGEGPERESLVQLSSELGITKKVLFRGRQSRIKTAKAMRRCAVFALPSHYEGLGCVYLEAMASGKPAIGCRGQAISEIIEHGKNGFLVEPDSESELGDLLSMLLHNGELRRRTGASARESILRKHTLDHQAQRLAQVYQESAQ
jgi:glycosyltransferase involved in cell wall biosynthesis